MTTQLSSIILSGIVIVLLQSYMRLMNKHAELKAEHDYMANHLLEVYKGICRLKRTAKRVTPTPKKAGATRKKSTTKPRSKTSAKKPK